MSKIGTARALVAADVLVRSERDRCLDIIVAEAERWRGSPDAQAALGKVAHLIKREAAANWSALVRLYDLRDGAPFETRDGIRAVKTEYYYPDGAPECVLLASGEYAHFQNKGNEIVREIQI